MEARILAIVGKLAGLAGLALGTFILIFHEILSKNFLPLAGLSQAQAFSVLIAAMILTFGISGIGMIAWLVARSSEKVTPLQLRSLSALFMAGLFLAVFVTGAALMNDRSTKAKDEDLANQERLKMSKMNNYAIVTRLSDELIGSFVSDCMVFEDRRLIDDRLSHTAIEVLANWRDHWQQRRTFSYAALETDLLRRLVTEGRPEDWILQEDVRRQRAIVNCIKTKVQRTLGTPPLLLD